MAMRNNMEGPAFCGRATAEHAAPLWNNPAIGPLTAMIAITITPTAYKALKVMRPETYDVTVGLDGMIRIWLDEKFVDRLGQMRGPGETYSDVILRLAEARTRGAFSRASSVD